MTARWRGRTAGPAIVALAALVAGASALAACGAQRLASAPIRTDVTEWQLVVRGSDGEVLLRVPLVDGRFTLRYRNSVYESLAEERFAITPGGQIALVDLAADEAAVLAEYYTAEGVRSADPEDDRRWVAEPSASVELAELPLAATEYGQRTLLVEGSEPVRLWLLVEAGEPTMTLAAEAAG